LYAALNIKTFFFVAFIGVLYDDLKYADTVIMLS